MPTVTTHQCPLSSNTTLQPRVHRNMYIAKRTSINDMESVTPRFKNQGRQRTQPYTGPYICFSSTYVCRFRTPRKLTAPIVDAYDLLFSQFILLVLAYVPLSVQSPLHSFQEHRRFGPDGTQISVSQGPIDYRGSAAGCQRTSPTKAPDLVPTGSSRPRH